MRQEPWMNTRRRWRRRKKAVGFQTGNAPHCPYCGSQALLSDTSQVYSAAYIATHPAVPIWLCPRYPECDSFVGCHKGTTVPLGRMANKELRAAKIEAHRYFDALWREKMKREGCDQRTARSRGYVWLAEQLGVTARECHMGKMDVELCRFVVAVCKPYYKTPYPNSKETVPSDNPNLSGAT